MTILKFESENRRTDNTMARRKRTDNTMAIRKRTDNTMARRKRTDNAMAIRKKDQRTNNYLQNTTQKTKDWATRISLLTGGESRCSGRVSSSCSTDCIRRAIIVTNPVISHEWGKNQEVHTTSETYPWPFVSYIFRNGGDRKYSKRWLWLSQ